MKSFALVWCLFLYLLNKNAIFFCHNNAWVGVGLEYFFFFCMWNEYNEENVFVLKIGRIFLNETYVGIVLLYKQRIEYYLLFIILLSPILMSI